MHKQKQTLTNIILTIMKQINELTSIYSLNKTLKFELKPIGKTLEHIQSKGLIARDEKRAEDYKRMKGIIDEYHKRFISECLENLILEIKDLQKYVALRENPKRDEKAFDKIKEKLRKQIVKKFTKNDVYADLFKKELIKVHLPKFIKGDKDKETLVEGFCDFTSYFVGFHKNRKNMYSEEPKSTAIAYRIIHENLPIFLDNMRSFKKINESEVSQHLADVKSTFSENVKASQLDEIFQLEYFNNTLTQQQIDIYNSIIGERTLENGAKQQGINVQVNLYNQQHKDNRLPLLKPLYKMILSDRNAQPWLPEEFASDEEMTEAIKITHKQLQELMADNGSGSLRTLLLNIETYDLDHIYIANDNSLTDISQQIFGQYDKISSAIKQEWRNNASPTPKERREPNLFKERIDNLFKSTKSFSITDLNTHTDADHSIQSYFCQLGAYDRNGEPRKDLFAQIENAYIAADGILSGKHGNIAQSDAETAVVKNLLDAYKSLQRFVKPLLGNGDEAEKDNEFYTKLHMAWDTLDTVTTLYNKVRNWLSRKPFKKEKVKLNFENPQLLDGWDRNKEMDYASFLLRKDEFYYLAIMDKKSNHAFDMDELPSEGSCYEKIDYKQIALPMGLGAFIRKCTGTANKLGWSCPLNLQNKEGKIITKEEEAKPVLAELIDCYKSFLDVYEKDGFKYKDFNFVFKPSEEYTCLAEFCNEVSSQGYRVSYRNVSENFINQLVNEGKLYLFKIWNKDFSEFSKGTPNMHTLYWNMLFDEKNLSDVVYKLNGRAEVFYRKKSLDIANTTVHCAQQPIMNKNKTNEKMHSTFSYDIIKDRRYTVDKFQFHVPITMNFKSTGRKDINSEVWDIIRNGGIKHIIGIDRGERHLLYLSLIDLKGNIVKQMSLNSIVNVYNGNTYTTKYKDLLSSREASRQEARKNWKKIENIKELKQGYLSQAVHVISKMIVENDAIAVLEDLNMGFMRGRQKIERSVYEQFEKALIDKLNYYVDKQKKANESGGLLHALQLTKKFESFKKLGRQSGCLFYIPAWNTSKIDPVTGFVNFFDTNYNADNAREFFRKFDNIHYNADKDWFEFTFDYNKFTSKAEGTRTHWTLCTHGTRIRTFKKSNQWDNEEVMLTDEYKKVFADAGIDIHGNLKEAICALKSEEMLERLMCLMKLLLQMRNSFIKADIDYILSPVADEDGNFYDSRHNGDSLPCDADANGAYNIARKGLWAIRQILQSNEPRLAITNKEWLNFVQQKQYLYE